MVERPYTPMTFSLIVRRTHMYLALFLTPWVLIYALSTMGLNHYEFFRELYGGNPLAYELESESTYAGSFADDATPSMVAEQILDDLGLDGAFRALRSRDGDRYTIMRQDPVTPRRMTYHVADGKLSVERQVFRTPVFLNQLHFRRGYREGLPVDNAWAFGVDLVIVAMVFWVASGLWMWWELRTARRWGALCAVAGIGLFTLFLLTI